MTSPARPSPTRANAAQPLWMRAAAAIAHEIAEGSFAEGSRLPAERELCRRLSISRVTLRKALQHLVSEGLLAPSHGRGWYVGGGHPAPAHSEWPTTLESFTETAARLGLPATSRVLRCDIDPASIDEAEQLGIAPGMPVLRLDRVRMLGGVAIALDAACLPASLVPTAVDADFARGSLYGLLAVAGVAPARAETTIESRSADADFAGEVGVTIGSPVLVLRQLVMTADDRPVLASTVRYAGDRYRLRTFFIRPQRAT